MDEPGAGAIAAALTSFDARVSSRLLRVELHRLGLREGITGEEIERWLSAVSLVPIDEDVLSAAEALPPATVATLDAIHLATALGLAAGGHIESLMTFDARLAEGANQHGIEVIAPG